MTLLHEILEKEYEPFTGRAHSDLIYNTDYVGVEIEAEQVQLPPRFNPKFWAVDLDDSLRNDGREFKFRTGLAGTDIVGAINELNSEDKKIIHSFNDRCSNHVHVDVRDLNADQLRIMLINWLFFEPLLFQSYIAPQRRANNFCVPLSLNPSKVRRIGQAFNTPGVRPIHALKQIVNDHCSKYDAVNLLSVYNFGTVEFRVFPGAMDRTSLLQMINFCLLFKDLGRKMIVPKFVGGVDPVKQFNRYTGEVFRELHARYNNFNMQASPEIVRQAYINLALMHTTAPIKFPRSKTLGTTQKIFNKKVGHTAAFVIKELDKLDATVQAARPSPPNRARRRPFSTAPEMRQRRPTITPIDAWASMGVGTNAGDTEGEG